MAGLPPHQSLHRHWVSETTQTKSASPFVVPESTTVVEIGVGAYPRFIQSEEHESLGSRLKTISTKFLFGNPDTGSGSSKGITTENNDGDQGRL